MKRLRRLLARAGFEGRPSRPREHLDTGPAPSDGSVTALLKGGPLRGRRLSTEIVHGRPPATIDASAADGTTCRYCLADWVQAGPSATYHFLYLV